MFRSFSSIMQGLRRSTAPAAERNKEPILQELKQIFYHPDHSELGCNQLKVLEISSGTGQHVAHFAQHLSPNITWQPSEFEVRDFESICAHIRDNNLQNVAPPVFIDISTHFSQWKTDIDTKLPTVTSLKPFLFSTESLDIIYNSNLMHISPFECSQGLFLNSGLLLKKGGKLITYGPYSQNGVLTPDSNVRFDAGLRSTDPTWGVRDIQLDLTPLAQLNGLKLKQIIDMPANNKLLVWEKQY